MDNNKIIIIVLIAIIVALLFGIFAMMPNTNKQDTNLTFMSNDIIDEGDNLQIKLTDANGKVLANQAVRITFTDKDNFNSTYSVVTNSEGVGELKLDKNAGEYDIIASYEGNEDYNGCNVSHKLTIKEKTLESIQSSSSSSNGGSNSGSAGSGGASDSSSNNDPGAFYSPLEEKVIHTGDVYDSPGGPMRHVGYGEWEPAE